MLSTMTTDVQIQDLPGRRWLAKRTSCGHGGIGPAFGMAVHSVGKCLRASGGKMTSMPMAIYLSWRDEDCDLAAGCTVEGDVTLAEGCEWLDVPGGAHASASHLGPYDSLQETHTAIRNWCGDQGVRLSGPCWEAYPTDPGLEPDPMKWQTDVYYPIER